MSFRRTAAAAAAAKSLQSCRLNWAVQWTGVRRAHLDLGLMAGQWTLFHLTSVLGTRSGFTLPVLFGQECKPLWLLFFSLYKIYWRGLLGMHVPGPYLEILVQELWAGLQPKQAVVRFLKKAHRCIFFFFRNYREGPSDFTLNPVECMQVPSTPWVFIFPKSRPNELCMGMLL